MHFMHVILPTTLEISNLWVKTELYREAIQPAHSGDWLGVLIHVTSQPAGGTVLDLTNQVTPVSEGAGSGQHLWAEVSYLDHVEFGQQIAVGQGQLIPIQELAPGPLVIVPTSVGVDLLWQRGAQVVIQFLQCLVQASLKGWRGTAKEGSLVIPATGYSHSLHSKVAYPESGSPHHTASSPNTNTWQPLARCRRVSSGLKKETLTKQ